MPTTLPQLLERDPRIWNGRSHALHAQRAGAIAGGLAPGLATGFTALDNALPAGGWPRAGVIEIQAPRGRPPPLRLVLPVAASLSQTGRRVVLVNPPFVPFAPALEQAGLRLDQLLVLAPQGRKDTWWSIESALRTQACGLVLAWPSGNRLTVPAVRRWQVAAAAGRTLCVLFSHCGSHGDSKGGSQGGADIPNVHLRLRVDGQRVAIVKARGTHQRAEFTL